MHRIFCLTGKSAAGKDTIYRHLLEESGLPLKEIIPYTTRPIRTKETDGVNYHFTDEAGYQRMRSEGRIIEERSYDTVHGIWRYFTADDGQIDLSRESCLMVGTPEACVSLKKYFGSGRVLPVYIRVDDGELLARALNRERKQAEPKYAEMCRRYLADLEDFSGEKLLLAGIDETNTFENSDLGQCIEAVSRYVADRMEEETVPDR